MLTETPNEIARTVSGLFSCNPTFRPVLEAGPEIRYIHIWGGRGRGGSHFVTEYALACLMDTFYFRGYFMRAIHKDIRESLWRDFKDRIADKVEEGLIRPKDFKLNDSTMTATYLPTGNTIQSRGFRKSAKGQTAKLKSIAGATHIFIEESEEIDKDDFKQLDDSLRTVKSELRIFLVFNPPKKNHWLIERFYNLVEARIPGYYVATPKKQDKFLSIFSTYHNNAQNLNESSKSNFEDYRHTEPEYYWTVIRGLVSEGVKGRVYRNWKPITTAEFEAIEAPEYYTIDFGFNDPLAICKVKRRRNNRYVKEILYGREMTDDELVNLLKTLRVGNKPIVADSADPKAISYLRSKGFNVIKAKKGPDSIKHGIRIMKGLTWHYTEDSKNLIYEYQEYRWELDENKNPTDKPIDKYNHLLDGLRYGELTDPWGGGEIDVR